MGRRTHRARRALAVAAAAAVTLGVARAQQQTTASVDSETFAGLQARSIGPAVMSGRIAALDVVGGDRLTIYVGTAGGGVWKSTDGGLRFKPIFDRHTQSIGAVTVDPSNPKIVWVGTGETWVRNSVSVGDGVYRSIDAGDTWSRAGLETSERIGRIIVHPQDGNTVYACAAGHLFDDHDDRGVYRTRDGGKTWEKVLFVARDTGCADLAMDPSNPLVLYAGMWQFRRTPSFFKSGGPNSGLFKSTDGGTTWTRLVKDLPTGDLGRIAVSVSPAKPEIVYAVMESTRTALFRSADRGESWTETNSSSSVSQRPFYFSLVIADPKSPDRVYKPGLQAAVSDDGGKTWGVLGGGNLTGPSYHSDVHALWVNPRNTDQLVMGTDGGVYLSADRGSSWRFVESLPVGQFYHVSYDMKWPYNVYGGLQDNSTWFGPSRRSGGIGGRHWQSLSPGDGFWSFVDPRDEDVVYDEIQGGNLFRTRKSTLERKDIRPAPKAGEPRYRFNWNTPIHLSRALPGTMYYAAQFLFRTRDMGESWERISPDLTTNDPQRQRQEESGGLTLDNSTAENNATIYAISESPRNPQIIWVGTDDGNVQVTRDGGKSWTDVVENVPGVPANTWVSSVEAGHFEEGTGYVTFDGHMAGDMKPYVYRTRDYGATWQPLALADLRGYAHVVKEDPVSSNLLFVGTEFGLFLSIDGGQRWSQFKANLPDVAVRDLAIHPREHDLILATHGRGLYIVDDLTPLRKLGAATLEQEVAFLQARPSALVIPVFEFGFNGDGEFLGETPAEVATITYYLKRRHMFGDLKLEIYDAQNSLISTIPGGKRRGVNRVDWAMRIAAPKTAPGASLVPNLYSLMGPRVPAGTYTVKMIKGKETFTSTITLQHDPRSTHGADDRALQRKTVMKLYAMVERLATLIENIIASRDKARAAGNAALADAMEAQRVALVSSKQGEGISGEEKLREELGTLYGNVNMHEGRPTESQLTRMAVFEQQLDAAVATFEKAAKAGSR
jgi:photosystem II stability/assembly factor-like uncharacterized protein